MSGGFTILRGLERVGWGPRRRAEPITIGVPLPEGAAVEPHDLRMTDPGGHPQALQVAVLDRWPDGSIRWALIDSRVDTVDGAPTEARLEWGRFAPVPTASGLSARDTATGVELVTGAATFRFAIGHAFPFGEVSGPAGPALDPQASGLRVDLGQGPVSFEIAQVRLGAAGPLRGEVFLTAVPAAGAEVGPLEVSARVEIFADTGTARVALTLRNRRRAAHPNGHWVLGDAGSVQIRSAVLTVALGGVSGVAYTVDEGTLLGAGALPLEIYQASSGGAAWNHRVHKNQAGAVAIGFRGYRVRSGAGEVTGLRATPIVTAQGPGGPVAVAIPEFWQSCPRAVGVETTAIQIGFVPASAAEPIELQGGEQKTHVAVVALAGDGVSDPPLAWCHAPVTLFPSPDWVCATGAVAFLSPSREDDPGYQTLVNQALAEDGFLAKRETADEYGWRDFGDLVADHESAFQPPEAPFVSHYNNQYDAIAGFGLQFLRSGEPGWLGLMGPLARHVRDIDIYHTDEDKAAYSGGLFWHTLHYADADTSTHRSYPAGRPDGGGPSSEHNYATGLMLQYFLTGDPSFRDAAIGLGEWVLRMDDGAQTPFRWLARGRTGLASATGSPGYHGPGRGPANSIVACLVAGRLTGEPRFAAKIEELIRRCIHPEDDLIALDLLDAERRWYYTVFLQALGAWLAAQAECGRTDGLYGYAQASLLHYARWMAGHEEPYLRHPERLEYPTETWVAQDMRKAEVFYWAALHATGEDRRRFLERASEFRRYVIETLGGMATRHFTRPIVLLLTNGLLGSWASRVGDLPQRQAPRAPLEAGPRVVFEPQKAVALRRARWLVGLVIAFGALALAAIVLHSLP